MDKIAFLRLWDMYHGLLTPTQQEVTDLYFNMDLSLSEIAESKGISRQAVSECLATCRTQLAEVEQKLHFLRMVEESALHESFRLTEIGKALACLKQAHPDWNDELGQIEALLDKDYSAEVAQELKRREVASAKNEG